jgi:hypothetical protein
MAAEPTEAGLSLADIMTAIRASGYLMEQEVATTLETLGFHVMTNRAFEDPDEGKSREMDVWALRRSANDDALNLHVAVELICECKNNTNPFIFIGRRKGELDKHDVPEEYLFPVQQYSKIVRQEPKSIQPTPAWAYLELAAHHYYYARDTKAVQFFKMVMDRGKWHARHEGIYDAIFYPLAKALRARQREVSFLWGKNASGKHAWLFFPVVVLNSDIYYIDSGASSPEPAKVDHVTFRRELKSKSVKGTFAVDFVTQEGLPKFINESVNPFAEHVCRAFQEKPELLQDVPGAWGA